MPTIDTTTVKAASLLMRDVLVDDDWPEANRLLLTFETRNDVEQVLRGVLAILNGHILRDVPKDQLKASLDAVMAHKFNPDR